MYHTNIDNSRIINTVMVLVKMFIMHCKYDINVLSMVAFTKKFMHNVMLLGRLYEKMYFFSYPNVCRNLKLAVRTLNVLFL